MQNMAGVELSILAYFWMEENILVRLFTQT